MKITKSKISSISNQNALSLTLVASHTCRHCFLERVVQRPAILQKDTESRGPVEADPLAVVIKRATVQTLELISGISQVNLAPQALADVEATAPGVTGDTVGAGVGVIKVCALREEDAGPVRLKFETTPAVLGKNQITRKRGLLLFVNIDNLNWPGEMCPSKREPGVWCYVRTLRTTFEKKRIWYLRGSSLNPITLVNPNLDRRHHAKSSHLNLFSVKIQFLT